MYADHEYLHSSEQWEQAFLYSMYFHVQVLNENYWESLLWALKKQKEKVMSGLLEQILSELQQIRLALSNQPAASNGAITQPAATPPAHDPFGGMTTAAPVQPVQITEAQVMGLIEPHLENAPLKQALSGVLAQMGIARLPDARPDQYADLYQRFQQVIAQYAGAQPAAQPASII